MIGKKQPLVMHPDAAYGSFMNHVYTHTDSTEQQYEYLYYLHSIRVFLI
jgi:hypothetical protein